jgi:hypothetical protein
MCTKFLSCIKNKINSVETCSLCCNEMDIKLLQYYPCDICIQTNDKLICKTCIKKNDNINERCPWCRFSKLDQIKVDDQQEPSDIEDINSANNNIFKSCSCVCFCTHICNFCYIVNDLIIMMKYLGFIFSVGLIMYLITFGVCQKNLNYCNLCYIVSGLSIPLPFLYLMRLSEIIKEEYIIRVGVFWSLLMSIIFTFATLNNSSCDIEYSKFYIIIMFFFLFLSCFVCSSLRCLDK